jgi:2'-5' RNA ligase
VKRIFIALKVKPGETLLKIVASFKSQLSNESIKWTNPENIHITLAFLGDTEEKMIKKIGSMLRDKCEGKGRFDLILKGTGVFRSLRDPRIVWAGIEPSEKLMKLKEVILTGLRELSVKMEERPFNPHLTIGRIKYIGNKDALKLLTEEFQNTEIQTIPVNEVILYESILLQSGPVYKPIFIYIL